MHVYVYIYVSVCVCARVSRRSDARSLQRGPFNSRYRSIDTASGSRTGEQRQRHVLRAPRNRRGADGQPGEPDGPRGTDCFLIPPSPQRGRRIMPGAR